MYTNISSLHTRLSFIRVNVTNASVVVDFLFALSEFCFYSTQPCFESGPVEMRSDSVVQFFSGILFYGPDKQ